MNGWQRVAVAGTALAAAGFGGAMFWLSRKWIKPPRVVFTPPNAEHAEPVRFASADGMALAGWLMLGEPDAPALILCHGYQRCMEETFSLGVDLRQRGFTVFLFDFRGCGLSDGRYTTIGDLETADLIGAVAWLRERLGPQTPIGVLGISMGGAVAIRAAATTPAIGAVVTDSAFAHLGGAVEHRFRDLRFPVLQGHQLTMRLAEWLSGGRVARVRPVDYVRRIAPRPLLFIHGTADNVVPFHHLDELISGAAEPKSAWVLAETTHAMARFDQPEEYVERVSRFFNDALRPEKPAATVPSTTAPRVSSPPPTALSGSPR